MDLDNATVLITGASRGIGAATARAFANAGARVVLAARGGDKLNALVHEIGDNARAISCDVSRYADVAAAVQLATDTFGGLDVMVNNAGVIEPISILADSDPEGWRRTIDINLTGTYNGVRACAPVMRAQGRGTIINLSSGAAHHPLDGWSHYCASKAGAHMLTQCADLEMRGDGVRIMGLSPGTVATQMQEEIRESGVNPVADLPWEAHVPADWPARAMLWMCTKGADPWIGQEVSLRDPEILSKAGLQ